MGGVYWYTHRSTGSGKTAPARPAVKTVTMARADMMKRVVLSGETVPAAEIDISPKYAGRIARVYVDLGDTVAAGDPLIQQDTTDLSISIGENEAGASQARADAVESRASYDSGTMKAQTDYQNALDTYSRYESLYQDGAVSLQERDDKYRAMMEAKSALDALSNQDFGGRPAVVASKEAAAEKAGYTVAALSQQAADMTIRAPQSGMIGYRKAEAGEWVSAGDKVLSIVDNSRIYVDCVVSEQDIGLLHKDEALTVDIASLGGAYPGVVTYISPAVDASTREYTVRLSLDTSSGDLRGGLFARTELTVTQRKHTLYVPKEAVGDDNGKKYVYTVSDDHKVKRVYVTIGFSNDESMEITKGLAEGDVVAISNVSRLRDGMAIDVEAAGGK